MKKLWQTPELIVLARGKPEEAVLTTCKYTPTSSGANSEFSACALEPACFNQCDAISPS